MKDIKLVWLSQKRVSEDIFFKKQYFQLIYSKIQPNDYLAVFPISSAISLTHPKHAISDHLIWRKNLSTIMQHKLICNSLKIINTIITTYTLAVMCLFSFTLKLHPLYFCSPHNIKLPKTHLIGTMFIFRRP